MYKVKDEAELKYLMSLPNHKLPKAARGEFPRGEELKAKRITAAKDKAYNDARSKASKAKPGAQGKSAYTPRTSAVSSS